MKREQDCFDHIRGRVALFGGTFNPMHVGHVRLCIELAELFPFEKLVCMPCAVPPHKSSTGIAPFALRHAFVQAAIEGIDRVCVSDLEAHIEGPSYTWRLLETWHERYKTRPLFIVGLEDFSVLNTWKKGLDLPTLADFIVVPRGLHDHTAFAQSVKDFWQVSAKALEGEHGMWHAALPSGMALYVPLPYLAVSATRLRALWLHGQDVRFLLPEECITLLTQYRAEITPVWSACPATNNTALQV